MGRVFAYQFTRRQQIVLLALCDHAKDNGTDARPGMKRLIWKTDYSKSEINRALRELREMGVIIPVKYMKGGRGRVVEWEINLANATLKAPLDDNLSDDANGMPDDTLSHKGSHGDAERVSPVRRKGVTNDTPTILNHHESSEREITHTHAYARADAPTREDGEYDPENLMDVRRWQRSREGRAYLFSRGVDVDSDKITTVRYMLRQWLKETEQEEVAL